jgi:nitrite reductase (NADH) small subunit/3-phenylpropionate/trans-cinnamate dioxygenase ferredoxin subunit
MARIRIAHKQDVPVGECKIVKARDQELALCHVEGGFWAIDNNCPHQGGPLGLGFLDGTELACPLHGWCFDVKTGEMPGNPVMKVKAFPVLQDGDELFVEL